jgi:hypothetical protein
MGYKQGLRADLETYVSEPIVDIEFAESGRNRAGGGSASWWGNTKQDLENQQKALWRRARRRLENTFRIKVIRIRTNVLAEDDKTEAFLQEEHHKQYNRPWSQGRDHADYLISRGLAPHHKLLDFGCGALRSGIWIIPHLAEGRDFGLEPNLWSLEAAVKYEVPLHGLTQKRPRFLCSDEFELGHFGTRFDYIVALGVFSHLTEDQHDEALKQMVAHLEPSGVLVFTGDLPFDEETMSEKYGVVVTHQESRRSKLSPNRGISRWTELRKQSSA